MKRVLFLICLVSSLSAVSQDFSGDWHARISVMGSNFPLILHVATQDGLKATLDSPDQKMFGKEVDSISLDNDKLYFYISDLKFSYRGSLLEDSIVGMYRQMDVAGDLNFSRKEVSKDLFRKKQTPVGPFNYDIEEIVFYNKKGKIKLAGTLTLPRSSENYPIVVLASGTGGHNRNGDMAGHSFFWVLADYLTKNGVGVLRYDDRGVGESEGSQYSADIYDFASDVNAAVKFLRTQDRFEENQIGVIGHSEGGVHSMLAIKKDKKIDFAVFLACIGTSGREIYIEQHKAILRTDSASTKKIEDQGKFIGTLIDMTKKKGNEENVREFLGKTYDDRVEAEQVVGLTRVQFVNAFLGFTNNTWFRTLMAFDAEKYLKKMKIPFFSLNGSEDVQVDPVSNFTAFTKATKQKNADQRSNSKLYLGLNHLFQKCETCKITEYGELEETFRRHAMLDIIRWLETLKK